MNANKIKNYINNYITMFKQYKYLYLITQKFKTLFQKQN
jgi:hypothetical protein